MASIINPQDNNEDEEQQQNAGPQQVSQGQSANIGGGGQVQPGTKSGRFTNISNYLKANQGFNAQGGGLAGKIAGNIQNQGQKIGQDVEQAKTNFQNQSQAGRTQFDENTVNSALNDPNQFVQNQANVDNFQKQLNAKYAGPQGIENANLLQNRAKNLQNLTQGTASEGGRFNILRQMFNKPTYSSGQQKLDNLLLQGNQGQLRQLTGTRQVGNQVVNTAQKTNQDAIAQAQQYKDEAAATAQETQNRLAQENANRQTELENQRLQQEADRKALQERLSGGLAARELSGDDLTRLGLQEGAQTYGVNLADYFSANSAPATLGNTMNVDQAMRMNALSKLAGGSDLYDPSAAGSFANSQYNFNKQALDADLAQRKATYDRETADQNNLLQQAWGDLGGNQGQLDEAVAIQTALNDPNTSEFVRNQLMNDEEIQRDLANLAKYQQAQAQMAALNNIYGIGNIIKRKQ